MREDFSPNDSNNSIDGPAENIHQEIKDFFEVNAILLDEVLENESSEEIHKRLLGFAELLRNTYPQHFDDELKGSGMVLCLIDLTKLTDEIRKEVKDLFFVCEY